MKLYFTQPGYKKLHSIRNWANSFQQWRDDITFIIVVIVEVSPDEGLLVLRLRIGWCRILFICFLGHLEKNVIVATEICVYCVKDNVYTPSLQSAQKSPGCLREVGRAWRNKILFESPPVLVSCPTRWSLYWPLASYQQRDGVQQCTTSSLCLICALLA